MGKKGNKFLISARNKDITLELLDLFGIKYFIRGKGAYTSIGRFIYLIKTDYFLIRQLKSFNPDICISLSSPYLSHAAFLLNKPCITFEDTELAHWVYRLYKPFSDCILTPSCFLKSLGKKQIFFRGYKELAWLNQKYFIADKLSLDQLSIIPPFIFIRFISRKNNHDKTRYGLTDLMKRNIITRLSTTTQIVVSTEKGMSILFPENEIHITPDKIHNILSNASLYIGESTTMAAEAAVLGVPAILLDNYGRGYTHELQEKYELIYRYSTSEASVESAICKAHEIIVDHEKEKWQNRRQLMLADKIDVTAFMVWFVENYPESVHIMRENPGYQDRFR
jgi:uncharacterized protein